MVASQLNPVPNNNTETCDVAIIGAGAAGLMAGIFAARNLQTGSTNPGGADILPAPEATPQSTATTLNPKHSNHPPPPPRQPTVILLDGARSIGAKILVAGGGRCNVTHHQVTPDAYAGATRNAIRKVLRRFDVPRTIDFFQSLGVHLKREDTGKLFPTTDRARTVLDALLNALRDAGAELRFPRRVESIQLQCHKPPAFLIQGPWGQLHAKRVIIATGGKSLPKSGSDGQGYTIARSLGHSITDRVFPSLVPLIVDTGHFVRELSGIATPVRAEVRAATGKRLVAFHGPALCTHFGLSGPAILDVSRYLTDARATDPEATLHLAWLPDHTPDQLDKTLQTLGPQRLGPWLRDLLPTRLADAILHHLNLDPATRAAQLRREQRRALLHALTEMPIPVTGDRGWTHAEVTAGGVPLTEINLETMHSRQCQGLYLCGEILDVDGRIGGFNFQWAWATGYIAGTAAANSLPAPD